MSWAMELQASLLSALTPIMFLSACAIIPSAVPAAQFRQEVMETERAFAKSMADRDHPAFASFLAEEAVFLSGEQPLRGKVQVAEWWKRYFEKPVAPFSWEPAEVEVLDSGGLALSSGPVRDPQGKLIGSFTSIWRKDALGAWRIVFDKGNEVCASPQR